MKNCKKCKKELQGEMLFYPELCLSLKIHWMAFLKNAEEQDKIKFSKIPFSVTLT